jgi:hypothetical protein
MTEGATIKRAARREDCVATGVSDSDVKLTKLHGLLPGKPPRSLGTCGGERGTRPREGPGPQSYLM